MVSDEVRRHYVTIKWTMELSKSMFISDVGKITERRSDILNKSDYAKTQFERMTYSRREESK